MSEALRKSAAPVVAPLERPITDLSRALVPTEDNDNQPAVRHAFGETLGFQVPAEIWVAMVACYAVFLGALLAATGGARAAFAIVISGVYVAMFFGTARTLLRQGPRQPASPLTRGQTLATLCGPLGKGEVALQMLIVPALVACFGIAVAVIRAVVA